MHPTDTRWHLKKEIQLTHIISTVSIAVAAMWYVGEIKRDVEMLKAQASTQDSRDERQDKTAAGMSAALEKRLDRLDEKLDRLIEGRKR